MNSFELLFQEAQEGSRGMRQGKKESVSGVLTSGHCRRPLEYNSPGDLQETVKLTSELSYQGIIKLDYLSTISCPSLLGVGLGGNEHLDISSLIGT